MSNIIDKIRISGVTYTIQGSGGGVNPTIELTQAEYDALVTAGTVSQNTYYIITDATAGDLTQYWTSAQTQSAITSATSGKVDTTAITSSVTSASTDAQIPTAKAVYNAVGSGGGGKAIEAGRGIAITTGETADTVSFNLPISANTKNSVTIGGMYSRIFSNDGTACLIVGDEVSAKTGSDSSLVVGYRCSVDGDGSAVIGWQSNAKGDSSFAFGTSVSANAHYSFAQGYGSSSTNQYEHSVGLYNVSNKANNTFGNSGNTLFSVGNGTSSARHNAFEIRQNGDCYLNNGTSDVKLQDYLQIKVVKLTQSAYDALSPNYDANTLYIIKD